jgi:hypothetical protein
MALIFIDYTPLYYTAIAKIPVPPHVHGKFVQIRNEKTEYLVFAPKEFMKYHAGIVERFCLDRGIEGHYDSEKKRYEIFDRSWIVAGGGKLELDRDRMTLRLFDDSMAYGKFDREGLAEKLLAFPEFEGFTVLID